MLLVRGLPQPERVYHLHPQAPKPLSESATTRGGGGLEGIANLPASSQQGPLFPFHGKENRAWRNGVTQ